jgi:hypothetical protein
MGVVHEEWRWHSYKGMMGVIVPWTQVGEIMSFMIHLRELGVLYCELLYIIREGRDSEVNDGVPWPKCKQWIIPSV